MIGNQLKEWREEFGASQEVLSRELEVSVSTIARWEQLKEVEIPNSKMLELALLALQIPQLLVLEYSLKQDCFHIHSIKKMLETNVRMILGKNVSNDYLVVAVGKTSKELYEAQDKIEEQLNKPNRPPKVKGEKNEK